MPTLTVYPDPDPETTTVDGYVGRGSVDETLATIRAGAGNTHNDTVGTADYFTRLHASVTTNQYNDLFRFISLFDTSSITDTDTIDSGTYSVFVTSKVDGLGGGSVRAVTSTPASNTDLVNADYAQTGTVAQASDKTIASVTTSAYNDWALNATGLSNISKTGVTKFGLRDVNDADNTAVPSWASDAEQGIIGYHADRTGTTEDPKLVVVSTAATTTSTSTSTSTTTTSSSTSTSTTTTTSTSTSTTTTSTSTSTTTTSTSTSTSTSSSSSTSTSTTSTSTSTSTTTSTSSSTSTSTSTTTSSSTSTSTSTSSSTSTSTSTTTTYPFHFEVDDNEGISDLGGKIIVDDNERISDLGGKTEVDSVTIPLYIDNGTKYD